MTAHMDLATREELIPLHRIRVAINIGNPAVVKVDAVGGFSGASVDIATKLAESLGVPLELITFPSAGMIVKTQDDNLWDVACLAFDPERSESLFFSRPYAVIDATYAVRCEGGPRDCDSVDSPGIRIATSEGAAYDLQLQRNIMKARRVVSPSPAESFEAFKRGEADVVAGVRQALEDTFQEPEFAVLKDHFHRIEHALAVHRARPHASRYVEDFMNAGPRPSQSETH